MKKRFKVIIVILSLVLGGSCIKLNLEGEPRKAWVIIFGDSNYVPVEYDKLFDKIYRDSKIENSRTPNRTPIKYGIFISRHDRGSQQKFLSIKQKFVRDGDIKMNIGFSDDLPLLTGVAVIVSCGRNMTESFSSINFMNEVPEPIANEIKAVLVKNVAPAMVKIVGTFPQGSPDIQMPSEDWQELVNICNTTNRECVIIITASPLRYDKLNVFLNEYQRIPRVIAIIKSYNGGVLPVNLNIINNGIGTFKEPTLTFTVVEQESEQVFGSREEGKSYFSGKLNWRSRTIINPKNLDINELSQHF